MPTARLESHCDVINHLAHMKAAAVICQSSMVELLWCSRCSIRQSTDSPRIQNVENDRWPDFRQQRLPVLLRTEEPQAQVAAARGGQLSVPVTQPSQHVLAIAALLDLAVHVGVVDDAGDLAANDDAFNWRPGERSSGVFETKSDLEYIYFAYVVEKDRKKKNGLDRDFEGHFSCHPVESLSHAYFVTRIFNKS